MTSGPRARIRPPAADGHHVSIYYVRFARRADSGFGVEVVDPDRALRVISSCLRRQQCLNSRPAFGVSPARPSRVQTMVRNVSIHGQDADCPL